MSLNSLYQFISSYKHVVAFFQILLSPWETAYIYRKSETTCNLLSNTLSKSIWIMHIFQQFPFVCISFGAIYNKNGYQFLDKGIIFDSFPFSQKHFFFFFCENISKTYQPKYLLFFSIYYNHTTTPIVRSWQKHL